MRRKFERPPAPALLVQLALYVVGAAGVGGGGVALGFWLDEPATETEIRTLAIPPACLEAFAAVDQGIRHWENADTHAATAIVSTEDLMPALLSGDARKATEIYEASDEAKRDAVDERALRDQALTEYAQLVADCAPEREQ